MFVTTMQQPKEIVSRLFIGEEISNNKTCLFYYTTTTYISFIISLLLLEISLKHNLHMSFLLYNNNNN